MTLAADTGATETRACSKCGVEVLHREIAVLGGAAAPALWKAEPHAAPCGQPCFGAGATAATRPWTQMHGWDDRCPRCGPLRVLPEVVEEMRRLIADVRMPCRNTDHNVIVMSGARCNTCGTASTDVINKRTLARCLEATLDEIAKLIRERDELQQALDQEREEGTALRMELAGREIEDHERAQDRGILINRGAQASARRVDAEAALGRCPDRPERITERTRLKAAVETARADEAQAQAALEAVAPPVCHPRR